MKEKKYINVGTKGHCDYGKEQELKEKTNEKYIEKKPFWRIKKEEKYGIKNRK